jgi:hypothetical protein
MIAGILGAFCNAVRDGAAGWEHGIVNPRIAAINDHRGSHIGIEAVVLIIITGCEFSATQELLVLATEEGNSSIRERCGQRNAEDSGAQPGTKCR